MANYKISGIWHNGKEITHYAFHFINDNSIDRAIKISKADAVRLLNNDANHAITWLWDYTNCRWKDGAKVEAISSGFLRSYHDGKVSDNLAHLINYRWIMP